MSARFFFLIFMGALVLHHGVEFWLDMLLHQYLKKRGNKVPGHLTGKVTSDEVAKAVSYSMAKLHFSMFGRLSRILFTVTLVTVGLGWIEKGVAAVGLVEPWGGLLIIGAVALTGGLLSLPEEIYFSFVLEARFGFNTQTPMGFVLDKLKGLVLATVLGGVLLTPLLALMDGTRLWWVMAYIVVVLFQLLLLFIYPVFIMPLFNKFEPVTGELAKRVAKMASRIGFPVTQVCSMDGSRRSRHANAFIVGMPGSRKIVLFDTLIEQLSVDELLAVLAHELGHFKLGHLRKRLLMTGVLGFVGFYLLGLVYEMPGFYSGLGFASSGAAQALIGFLLLSGELLFPLGFAARQWSRHHEFEADRFARTVVGGSEDLKSALITLHRKNLTSPGAPRLYRAYHNTHPSLRERLAALD